MAKSKAKSSSSDVSKLTFSDFGDVVEDLRSRFPALSADDRFTLWFLRAYITESETDAADAVVGGTNDKGIDAILIDDAMRCVVVVQAKYRQSLGEVSEKRNDVINLAEIACQLGDRNEAKFAQYVQSSHGLIAEKLRKARDRVLSSDYKVWLYFVTLGNVSTSIREDSQSHIQKAACNVSVSIIDSTRVVTLLQDYLDGVAPPIPTLDLEMESSSTVKVNGVSQRYDTHNQVESWVFSMRGDAVADLYKFAGIRLFARNVRGFLGSNTAINSGMLKTLRTEPDRFFYYNNGITILCDEAKRQSQQGKDLLHVSNPQVINGQQTTRTLAAHPDLAAKASVLVKVIQVANRSNNGKTFDNLLSRIVAGTNWQNAIRVSDLMSNDRVQIDLERSMRKLSCAYIRKRQTKSEVQKAIGNKHFAYIFKEEMAQIVAACEIEPHVARGAKEKLFEEQYYDRIFKSTDPYFYLSRYWLMREVLYCARGDQNRKEARFLVLNFVWSQISSSIRTKNSERDFVEKCRSQSEEMIVPISQAIVKVFNAVKGFFQANRGSGSEAVDIATFCKSKRASAKAFHDYWMNSYKQKQQVERLLQKALAEVGK